jgi:predicted nucleic acid-binding protein
MAAPMAVLDASVVVDALVVPGLAGDLGRAEMRKLGVLQVPAIFTAEVTSALRRLVLARALSPIRASTALSQILTVRTLSYPFEPFASRVWELRDVLTVYDAWYVALAERLGTEFVTADKRLAGARGARCPIRWLGDQSGPQSTVK